jgi:hypothetical protein
MGACCELRGGDHPDRDDGGLVRVPVVPLAANATEVVLWGVLMLAVILAVISLLILR